VDEKPCCAAEALRLIRQGDVGGIIVGISMLDPIFAGVNAMDLPSKKEQGNEFLKKVKIFNYVPPSAEGKYRTAHLAEFQKHRERDE
jgi:hypothetical protein